MTHDSSNEIQISATSTSCQDCVFSIVEDGSQTGCMAGQVDKFRNAGIEVLEVFNEEQGEFYIIKDKLCPYYRPFEIKEHFNITPEELLENIKAQLKIPYHIVIFLRKKDSIDDLKKRLDELHSQKVKPRLVTVIDRSHEVQEDVRSGEIIKLFHNHYSFDYWRTQTATARDQVDSDLIDLCYDNTKKAKYFFYMVFEASMPIPLCLSEEIHTSLHDKMISFVALTPNGDGVGGGALKLAHAKYGGNSFQIPLEEKIKHYDDSVHLIIKAEELCPSLRT